MAVDAFGLLALFKWAFPEPTVLAIFYSIKEMFTDLWKNSKSFSMIYNKAKENAANVF